MLWFLANHATHANRLQVIEEVARRRRKASCIVQPSDVISMDNHARLLSPLELNVPQKSQTVKCPQLK